MSDEDKIPSDEEEGDDGIPPKSKISYSEVSLFQETEVILPFTKMIYKLSISVGPMTNKIHPVNCVLDRGVSPRLIRVEFLEGERLRAIHANSRSALNVSTNRKVSVVRTIMIHVRMGASTVRVVLGVLHDLAVPGLLRNSFIDRFVKGLSSSERKIVR